MIVKIITSDMLCCLGTYYMTFASQQNVVSTVIEKQTVMILLLAQYLKGGDNTDKLTLSIIPNLEALLG